MLRTILSGLLAVAVIGASIAVGVPHFTENASATATGSTNAASDLSLTGDSYSGQVDDITIESNGYVEWENMDSGVSYVKVKMQAQTDSGWETFASEKYTDVDDTSDGNYSYGGVGGSAIDDTSFTTDDFSADEDGEVREENFPVKVIVKVVGPDGTECKFVDVHTVNTEVTNLENPAAGGNGTIDGKISMSDEDDCPECVGLDPKTEQYTNKHSGHDHGTVND